MKHAEMLVFSQMIEEGMQKEAFASMLGKGLRFGARDLGATMGHVAEAPAAAGRFAGNIASHFGGGLDRMKAFGGNIAGDFRRGFNQSHPAPVRIGEMNGPFNRPPQAPLPKSYLQPSPSYVNKNPFHATAPTPPSAASTPGWEYGNQTGVNATTGTGTSGGLYDQMKSRFTALKPWQKFGVGYGAVTAASAPGTAMNNAKADWQQQNPVMSWMGRTFGGMQDAQRRSYLMPSF